VAGTLASYVLGDSVTQFSTVIGVYLSALGLGAWLSRSIVRGLVRRFVEVEIAVALIGGCSAPLLFFAFGELPQFFRPVLYGLVLLIGTLVGLEIPLVMRILREAVDFKELVARVLTVDYLGALVASLLFPIFMVPRLGLVRTSLVFGLANAAVGLWSTWLFAPVLTNPRPLRVKAGLAMLLLTAGIVYAEQLTDLAEENLYADPVVYARTTPYQRIVMTRTSSHFQLFLSGSLQFSSVDEYRYHESLVHPAMAVRGRAERVLVLGGGDGLAVREILRYPEVEQVVVVDLDPEVTRLASRHVLLRQLNRDAMLSPRVQVVNADALVWLRQGDERFDAVFVDFPDPHNYSLGKLYTTHFYRLLRERLRPGGVVAVQSTSPLMARRSFWCVIYTLEAAGFAVRPYHAPIPSFGEWGFALAARAPFPEPAAPRRDDLRFLDARSLPTLFVLSPDMGPVEAEVNRLDNQALVRYYDEEWRAWN
jgi:spermidine synthase